MTPPTPELWSEIVVLRESPRDAVVIKPAGLSVELPEDARADGHGRSLLAWARACWPGTTPRLPHRLDRLARGIVVLALDQGAAEFHAASLRERRWGKVYLCRLAVGAAAPARGVHRVHLRTRGRRAEVVRSGGRPAILELLDDAAVPADHPNGDGERQVLIRLDTGRYHQIRATMAHLGAPVSGDPLYDPDAATRSLPPSLEHALLVLPRLDGSGLEVFWRREDPAREEVAPSLLDHLDRMASDLRWIEKQRVISP